MSMNIEKKIERILQSASLNEINKMDILPEPLSDKGYYLVYYPESLYRQALVDIMYYDSNNMRIWYDRHLDSGRTWENYIIDKLEEFDCIGAIIYLNRDTMQAPFFYTLCKALIKFNKRYCTINYEQDDNGNTLSGIQIVSRGYAVASNEEEELYKKLFSDEITFISGRATVEEKIRNIKSIKQLDILNYKIINGKAAVMSVKNVFVDNLTIPAFVDIKDSRYPVVAIAGFAFANCRFLSEITIPNGICEVGGYACLDKESVPSGHTFFACTSLKKIVFPESVETVHDNIFLGCTSLRVVDMPGVISLSPYVFGEEPCEKLSSIRFSPNILKMGEAYCTPKYEKIEIPEHAKVVGCRNGIPESGEIVLTEESGDTLGTFDYNPQLRSLTFSDTYDYMNSYDSYDNSWSIDLEYCPNLEKIDISNVCSETTFIPIINACEKLKTLLLPKKITGIAIYAITQCESLKTLTIPETVNDIWEAPPRKQRKDCTKKNMNTEVEEEDDVEEEYLPHNIEQLIILNSKTILPRHSMRIKKIEKVDIDDADDSLNKMFDVIEAEDKKRRNFMRVLVRLSMRVVIGVSNFMIKHFPKLYLKLQEEKIRVDIKNIAKVMPTVREIYVAGETIKIKGFRIVASEKTGFIKYLRK